MNILTFDIEDWFHLLDYKETRDEKEWLRYDVRIHANVNRILQLLDQKKLKATFFCLGWVAEKYPEIIRSISDQGHEIGSHSHMHGLVYEQNREVFKKDLQSSIRCIEDVIGEKVHSYRAPGFSLTEECLWAYEVLQEEGLSIDCSLFPANRAHGGMPSIKIAEPCILDFGGYEIKEFPMNFYKIGPARIVFSGGGYFRVFPYPLVRFFFGQSDYVMTYFHPRDFDSEQPMIDGLSMARKFKSYYGLSGSFQKFTKILDDFDFISLGEADCLVDWSKVQRIKFTNN